MPNKEWYFDGLNIRCAPTDENTGTYIAVMESSRSPQETQANARLIAKAPEMLAMLAAIIDERDRAALSDDPAYLMIDRAIERARALLAEIDGGPNV